MENVVTVHWLLLAAAILMSGAVAYRLARRRAGAVEVALAQGAVLMGLLLFLLPLGRGDAEWSAAVIGLLLLSRAAGDSLGTWVAAAREARGAKAADAPK